MSSQGQMGPPSNPTSCTEFHLRVPKNVKKRYNVMRFHGALNVDVTKWSQVKMERENNLKDFKMEEEMPKFGAGSEYGRDQREEAKRKKYGIIVKKYNPDDQPWVLKTGGKAGKRYRGIREGGVSENASYYIFVKAPDGGFEAYPISEWYNFTPVQRYKTLNAEEAEEEFGRRDKVLNYFSIMLRKRGQNDDGGDDKDEGEVKEKKKKKPGKYGTGSMELKISDMDEWMNSSDADSDEDGAEEEEKESKAKKDKKKTNSKKKKKKPSSDDDEPIEDSDDGDDEGREVDYISDVSSSDDELPGDKVKNDMKGVEDEDAIRKMEDSETDEENEEEKKENPDEAAKEETAAAPAASAATSSAKSSKEKKEVNKKTAGSSSESSSDTSDSDDFDNDTNFHSAMFMQKSKRNKGDSDRGKSSRSEGGKKEGRGSEKSKRGQKRNMPDMPSASPPSKKSKAQNNPASAPVPTRSFPDIGGDGITEDAVRRYLMRKPMTTTELLHKFKAKKIGVTREQMVNTIAQILKRLNPDKQTIKDKMYLSIKQAPH